MLEIADALEAVIASFTALPAERVALDGALGRHLFGALEARRDAPSFDNSAMDGYAVRADETSGATATSAVSLAVIGESRAGGPPPAALAAGSAMRIFTGAPVPAGADAVVMQEDTERTGATVAIELAAHPGKHVRHRGEDIRQGDPLLPSMSHLDPGAIGLLASQSHAFVAVHRRPIVAIAASGDELRDLGEELPPGAIVNSNAHALAAQVAAAGGIPRVLPRAADTVQALVEMFQEALRADVVLTTGGVSVGDHDRVREAMAAAGIEPVFWKVRMKPGKPIAFGRAGVVPVVGLPGNPISAMVGFELFVRPGLRKALGDPHPFRPTVQAELAEDRKRKPGRPELCRVQLTQDGPRQVATVAPRQGSAAMSSMAGADALAIFPPDLAEVPAGTALTCIVLDGRKGSSSSPFPPR